MVRVVADTHALIWYLLGAPRLSATALGSLRGLATIAGAIGVPSVSIVEMVYLEEKGRIPALALSMLQENLAQEGAALRVIPIGYEIALAVRQVPRTQVPDMPDRIIAATALHLGAPLISRDRRIKVPGVETIW
ncbi:MAG: type II toxin-antitoxin system VapC family toxin [Anaerolineae bacterium]|nr:type II toxin-antitoxin system VapC family toxin [Anaerolineae bacterium]